MWLYQVVFSGGLWLHICYLTILASARPARMKVGIQIFIWEHPFGSISILLQ
jgi:hypothetical protein